MKGHSRTTHAPFVTGYAMIGPPLDYGVALSLFHRFLLLMLNLTGRELRLGTVHFQCRKAASKGW